MRILFITSTFPVHSADAQVPWLLAYVKELRKKGIKIEIFAPASKGSPSNTIDGITVHRFRYAPASWEILTHDEGALFKLRNNKFLFFLPILYFLFGSIAIVRHCLHHPYDIIHVHWPFPQAIFGILAQRINGGKLVYSIYGAEFALVNRLPLGTRLFRLFLRKADVVIGISQFTKDRIISIIQIPVTVIPFTTSLSSQRIIFNKNPLRKKEKRVLFVGRLIERKGIRYLIEAMRFVIRKVPNAKLDIVGQGPLFDQLQNQINTFHLSNKIVLHGRVDTKTLKKIYQTCYLFVLPAIVDKWGDTEGLGVVILEAMSMGKPVVASHIGGITDIVINEKNGLLVPQKNTISLSRAIVRLLTNESLRRSLGRQAYHTYKGAFGWPLIVQKTIQAYQS